MAKTAAEISAMSVLHPRFVREIRDAHIRDMRARGKTLQVIADEFGLTRERVRQIAERKA